MLKFGNLSCAKHKRQILVALIVSLLQLGNGVIFGWSSTGLPSLAASEDFHDISLKDQSWIAALLPLGAFISAPLAGLCLDYFGRKKTLVASSTVQILGWLAICSATDVPMLYTGRFVAGLSAGASIIGIMVYIGDITEPEIRGILSSFQLLTGGVGILFSILIGSLLPWRIAALISALPALTFLALSIIIPESQRYYLCTGKVDEATRVTRWIHESKSEAEVDDEIMSIMQNLEEINRLKATSGRGLLSRHIFLPLLSSSLLMVFQQLCGYNALLFYTVYIFQSAGTTIDAYMCTILVGILIVVFTALSTILIDVSGRRVLLLVSGISMGFLEITLGVFFGLKPSSGELSPYVSWIPVTALLLYFVMYSIGYGSIPWILMRELLPSHVIGLASSVTSACHYFLAFWVVFSLHGFIEIFGISEVFMFFGFVSLTGSLFVYLAIPETKLKTLEEIQLFYGVKTSILKQENLYDTFEPIT